MCVFCFRDTSSPWRIRRFAYDGLSRLGTATSPESSFLRTSYSYDNVGNLLTKVSPQPNQLPGSNLTETTTYAYDAINRVTQLSYLGIATPTVKFGYDGTAPAGCGTVPPTLTDSNPIGYRTSMCDGSGATSWSHDQMGRTLTEKRTIIGSTAATKTLVYTWNHDGSMDSLTYPSGHKLAYTYSGAARALTAKDMTASPNIAYVSSVLYTPDGAIGRYVMGSSSTFAGITASLAYNNRLQPSILSASTAAQTIFSLSYGYGPIGQNNGNVSTIVNNLDNNRTQTFTYDSLNRVKTAQSQATSGTACWGQSFGYDPWGNLLSETVTKCSAGMLSASADFSNRLQGNGYIYDVAGNLTKEGSSSPSWTYAYDGESRLVTLGGSASDTFAYDGDGERVYKSNGAKFWRVHGGPFLTKTGVSGGVIVERIYFNGKHIAAWHPSGSVNYFMQDSLGGEHIVTDASGTVLNDIDTLPFGGEIDYKTSADPSYKFAGMERDDENSANLDYDIARYYDLRMGRFMITDPSHLSVTWSDPQTWNRYSYSLNNPLAFVDDNGLWPTYVHNKIIDEAFPGLSKSEVQTLKRASYDTDFNNEVLGMGPQDPSNSYIHGMSNGTDPDEIHALDLAQSLGDRFINDNLAEAVVAQREWIASGHTGLCPKALTAFGNAAHTVMDRFSPPHRGNQRWSGVGFLGLNGALHFSQEAWASQPQRRQVEQAIQDLFLQTFGWQAEAQAEDGLKPHFVYRITPCGGEGQKPCEQ